MLGSSSSNRKRKRSHSQVNELTRRPNALGTRLETTRDDTTSTARTGARPAPGARPVALTADGDSRALRAHLRADSGPAGSPSPSPLSLSALFSLSFPLALLPPAPDNKDNAGLGPGAAPAVTQRQTRPRPAPPRRSLRRGRDRAARVAGPCRHSASGRVPRSLLRSLLPSRGLSPLVPRGEPPRRVSEIPVRTNTPTEFRNATDVLTMKN
ncbi:protein FAM107B isoform X2 [Gallus gallus]|uniref:protein FAM107B isoform X2 n=1 Tax=Gallus gallus TaxID=9031 RepID=UPI001AE5827C|nr:protein FAM107B isoform X2 [Gallus gallus]